MSPSKKTIRSRMVSMRALMETMVHIQTLFSSMDLEDLSVTSNDKIELSKERLSFFHKTSFELLDLYISLFADTDLLLEAVKDAERDLVSAIADAVERRRGSHVQ